MRILSVSDRIEPILYNDQAARRFEGVDLILACGDLAPEYLTFLRNIFKVTLFYVAGNHDIRYPENPPAGCINLHGRIENFRGFKILGLEGSRWYNGGLYQYTEAQMRKTIFSLWPKLWWRGGADIIVTHAPPRYIHDAEDPCHKGFKCYHRLIDKFSPRCLVHGHIHSEFTDDAQRVTVINQTKVINSYGFFIFEIDSDRKKERSR